ncbi:MAG: CBS and ACT domain-containing protein [Armatimonadota bacterium]|nr:CBS and ACT domain-containing protein [Armatimonadota bacterium]MDR7422288.1 CBS and ACT domain-containing protein [Armatimonadota bacterium]MDR7453760.1 CBS and ACT domain-containing protein [Armatimonadota bacterium]MDR7456289.1 CBS and ACT domain-containing protein [Armatimonadota bacterium]MDR7496286.1 CBS and ACT domain-containing protein [Armatimonadota bacterium]
MSSPPITVDVKASLAEALALMRQHDIRRLPVLQRSRLVGIVTWTDLMRAQPSPASTLVTWEIPALLRSATVREIMTPDPITIGPDAPIEAAAVIMRREKIGGLPVTEGPVLRGVITESDIFKAFIDLTGLRQGGARLVVEVADRPGAVAGLAGIVESLGVRLTSFATYQQAGRRLAVVRVDAPHPLHVVQALDEGGYPVIHLAAAPEADEVARGTRYAAHTRAWEPKARERSPIR